MHKQEIQASFERSAAHYDEVAHLQRDVLADLVSLVQPHAHEGAVIADIGCGTGALSAHFAPSSYRLIGCDLSHAMCVQAYAKGEDSMQADAAMLPLRDACADIAMSSLCLQWVEDIPTVLTEMLRVLKPGGVLAVSSFVQPSLGELRTAFSAVDHMPHTLDFAAHEQWQQWGELSGANVLACNLCEYVEQIASVRDFARQLKQIGASNKHIQRRKAMLTPSQWQRVERTYPRADDGTLQAKWHVVQLLLRK